MKNSFLLISTLIGSILLADNPDGVAKLDDLTSRAYVVTNAFIAVSNDVDELIQNVSPSPDFSTNNTELVDTITEVNVSSGVVYSLEPATNYTDSATNSLNAKIAPAITNTVTKFYIESLGTGYVTTNDVCSIVTNRTVTYSFVADGVKYEISNYGFTDVTSTGMINGVSFALNKMGEDYSFGVTNVPPMGYSVIADTADVGFPTTPNEWRDTIVVNEDYNTRYMFMKNDESLGVAMLYDLTNIAPTVISQLSNDVGYVTSNEVCNIVTNETDLITGIASAKEIDYVEGSEASLSVSNIVSVRYIKNGEPIFGDFEEGFTDYWKVIWQSDMFGGTRTGYDPYNDPSSVMIFASPEAAIDWGIEIMLNREMRNSLGLARFTDITNTVTKSYVEALGIEAGISAATATNIAQSALGSFAATGTVKYAEEASTAIGADAADDAYNLRHAEDQRSASQIFSILDESASTNYAQIAAANAVANADTTYRRTIGITNLNQSVQYVNITDTAPTTLAITMPTDGATKDWMVYVVSVTNVTLSLPTATWWMADTAYTNDVPPATPTAFWFSQVTDGIFILGRQELTEVVAP